MRTPSPSSATSHSDAAAALIQLSQTPPQPAVNSSTSHLEQHSTNVSSPTPEYSQHSAPANTIMGTPKSPNGNDRSSSSPMSYSTGVIKVSNSDNEDMIEPEGDIDHNDSIDAPKAPRAVSCNDNRMPEALPIRFSAKSPAPTLAPGLTVAKRQNTASFYRSPYAPVEDPRGMNVDGSGFSRPQDGSTYGSQFGTQSPQTAYPIVTVAPDELDSYIHRTVPFSQQDSGTHLRHASIPVHFSNQPPQSQQAGQGMICGRPSYMLHNVTLNGQRISAMLLPDSRDPTMGLRRASQPPPRTQLMLPPANVDGRSSQPAKQPASSVQELTAPPSSFGVLVPDRASSGGAGGRKKMPIPCAPARPSAQKRVRVPPNTQNLTASRDGFGPKLVDIQDFKYRTIKSINMPARIDVTPGEPPPEPTPDSYPYDEDIDYRPSYLIWLCDDLELAYSETVRRYKTQFRDERTVTEDTVRKRHILYLEKLARKYGLKPDEEIEEPGGRVAIRGKQVGHQYNTINGVHVYSAAAGHDVAGKPRRRRTGNEPTKHRGFLKACICVWHDTATASFEEIKLRLENEYGWNIGVNTVQKIFYAERARVYDTFNVTGAVDHETFTRNADEDLDQLKLHYQQRQAYLLRTYVQDVPAEDVAYMYQLEQLIASKEQEQLQRAQQIGSDPIRMIEEAADEVHDAGEGEEAEDDEDVMMQDADPGPTGDRDVN
ncbi:hypothetical protein E8E11_007835 [Didymella keratinophila]|nr:hypothetical protein E8E11_007835 [Didymella keratinophila]